MFNTSILKFRNWNRYQKNNSSDHPPILNYCIFHFFFYHAPNHEQQLIIRLCSLFITLSFFFRDNWTARSNVKSHHHHSALIQGLSKHRPPHECQPIRKSWRFSSTWRPTSRWTSIQPFLPRGWSGVRGHRSVTFRFSLPLFESMINVLALGKNHFARENATSTAVDACLLIYVDVMLSPFWITLYVYYIF